MDKYKEIRVFGIPCYTDAYICDDEDGYVYLISIFGRPMLMKAISAAIISGRTIEMDGMRLERDHSDIVVRTQNLPGGVTHKILYAPSYFTGDHWKIIVGLDYDAGYDFIDSVTTTPLKREWKKWLWENVLDVNEIKGFGSINGLKLDPVFMVRVKEIDLDKVILEGLKSGQIH